MPSKAYHSVTIYYRVQSLKQTYDAYVAALRGAGFRSNDLLPRVGGFVLSNSTLPTNTGLCRVNSKSGGGVGDTKLVWIRRLKPEGTGSAVQNNYSMQRWVLAALTLIPQAIHPFGPDSTIYNLTKIWPVAQFSPAGLVLNDDGSAWLSSLAGNRLAHATLDGKLTIVQLPSPYSKSQIESLTRDLSGNLWFTETQSYDGSHNYVGEMTRAGRFRFYPIRGNNAFLMGIAAVPDGSIWFTEFGADRVGRILPSGKITEYYLGRNAFSQTIVAGPDGNLWTTGAHCVVRISPNGQMKRIIVPIEGQYRNIQSSGSALWMTAYKTKALIRITPSGGVTEFSLTRGRFGIIHLDPGPGGTLLGTDMDTGTIEQLSDDGELRPLVSLGVNAFADHVVMTPQGRIWFTVSGNNAYGHAP